MSRAVPGAGVGYKRGMRRIGIAILAIAALTSCGDTGGDANGSGSDGGGGGDVSTTPIVFETVAKGAQGPAEAATVVARSQAEFDAAWTGAAGEDPPSLGGVDFASKMVVAVFQGQQPTAGYDIEITSVGSDYAIIYEVSRPAEGCITAQVLTSPFHVVTVPRSDDEVSFSAEEKVNPC